MTTSDTHRAIDTVWRTESATLIAGLGEELPPDALVSVLERWPWKMASCD